MTIIHNETHVPASIFAVQIELQKKAIVKDAVNPFHSSKYLTLKALLDIVMPVLEANKILLMQMPSNINGEPALQTILYDTAADGYVESIMPLMLKSDDPQAQGSAITYARRYALMAILGLVAADEDDDGQHATNTATAARTQPTGSNAAQAPAKKEWPASDAQRTLMFKTVKKHGFSDDEARRILLKMAGVDEPELITKTVASELIPQLFGMDKTDFEEVIK